MANDTDVIDGLKILEKESERACPDRREASLRLVNIADIDRPVSTIFEDPRGLKEDLVEGLEVGLIKGAESANTARIFTVLQVE